MHFHQLTPVQSHCPSVKGVAAGSPPGEEQGEANSLEDTCNGANKDGIHWAFLREDLGNELREHIS